MISRRRFLSTSLAAGASLAMPAIHLPNASNKKLGVALVGLGYYSTDILAPSLQLTQHCELRGIVTGTPSKISKWQRAYDIPDRNVYNYETMHQVANNDDIDVIYIVLPTGLHSKYSIIAADAGKHVWCEKPMARTESECQAIIDACRKNKVKLSIGYRMQHEPNTQTVMRYAREQPYGSIVSVKAEAGYRDGRSNHWKLQKEMGGGAMYDMGVYPLNAARYSTALEPSAVKARHETTRPEIYTEVDETTLFDLEFPGGIMANCKTSFGMGLNVLHIDCRNGWYELKPFQSYSGVRGTTSDGKMLNAVVPNQQAKQMDDDALAILNDTDVLVPGEEGMKDIRIVEAVYRAAAEDRWIKL